MVSLCSPSGPGTHRVDQAGPTLTDILLPLPLECRDERCVPEPALVSYALAELT